MTASDAPRAGDEARATVYVAVAPHDAFRIFTEEIDLWWRHGVRFRNAGPKRGLIRIEPGVNGRIFESFEGVNREPVVIEIGRVTLWQPPERLSIEWRNANFTPAEKTEVDISFRSSGIGCEVRVAHRGWAEIRPDHPVRHGGDARQTLRMIGTWWGELLSSFREFTSSSGPAGQ
jgi:hypothetical protein